jgi:hypothetical protein
MTYINRNKGIKMSKNQMQQKNSPQTVVKNWGQKFNAANIIMPKIILQQKMSELVEDGKAKPGDLVDNLTDEVLAPVGKPLEIIPFRTETVWMEKHNGEFAGVKPYDGQELPFDEEKDGVTIVRDKVMNAFVLIPGITDVPYIIPFRRTSYKAGRKIETRLYRNVLGGLNPCAFAMNLTAKKVDGKKGTYFVVDAATGRKANNDEAILCYRFNESVLSGQRKVDYSEEKEKKPTPQF